MSHNNMGDPRAMNIHINPNLLVSSGTVHVNKKKFNVNSNVSVRPPNYSSKTILNSSDNKVHYNPKFFRNNQNYPSLERDNKIDLVNFSKSNTIHVNPSFKADNLAVDNNLIASNKQLSSYSDDLLFESFRNHLDEGSYSILSYTDECFVSKSKKVILNPDFNGRDNYNVIDSWTDNPVTKLSSNVNLNPVAVNTSVPQSSSSFNNKYRKVNSQSALGSKMSRISKYKIQRNNSLNRSSKCLVSTPIQTPSRKPRLSGSFKKIGKRKLVRKSMIQNYISSRRHSVPIMIQHLRSTMASRKKINKNISRNKYKFVSNSIHKTQPISKLSKYKCVNIPSKSKLKWNRTDIRTQDFIKFGKRKIVRKSILQSILEARRTKVYAPRKYSLKKQISPKKKSTVNVETHKSRYKVIRNVATPQSSHLNNTSNRRESSFNSYRKKDTSSMSQFLTSKSIFFRMPPSLRLKIRMEEKRKRLMLLKKVNNRKKCMYYNRFGCCKGLEDGTCKKLHDPKSISICRKFLKGMCDGEGCKLSHQVGPEKMPTCHQFLAGVCIRPSCPFLHVKLSDTRPVCTNFLQGFCQEGNSCTKRHQFVCPEWDETGACKADKCPYPHPQVTQSNVDKKYFSTKLPKKNTSLAKATESVQSDITKNTPPDDIRNRYFSAKTNNVFESVKNVKKILGERKPDTKDGITSVYCNDSLLSFIPFS